MVIWDRFRDVYYYKIKTVSGLATRGELGYLTGIIAEKSTGRNVYLEYLRHKGHNLTVDRDIKGHTMTLDLSDLGLSRYLLSRGQHEPNATPVFLETLERSVKKRSSDELAVLDIGANIGYFALLEANVLGERGTVYAFEPAPSNCHLLGRNVSQNGYQDRIEIRPIAMGGRDGSAELLLSDHSNWNRIATKNDDSGNETIDVELKRVDSFLSNEGISGESVVGVRMDVEGYESSIFKGMHSFLKADSPAVLFVELHPSELTGSEMDEILSFLSDSGFSVQFAGQDWKIFEINEPAEVASIGGTHVRLVLERS